MKLLIINDYGIKGGGTENRVRLLILELLKRKTFEEIHLLELEEGKSSKGKLAINMHKCSRKDAYEKTKSIIENFGIDIVQIHNLLGLSTDPIKAAKRLKKPVIWFAHDYWTFCGRRNLWNKWNNVCESAKAYNCTRCIGWKSFFYIMLKKRIINKADIAIAPTSFVFNIHAKHKVMKGKWKVIHPWINLSLFKPNKKVKKENKVLYVGPLEEFKGAFLTLKAFKIALNSFPNLKLRFVGERNKERVKEIKNLAKKEGILMNIEFKGFLPHKELVKEYQKAKVYVCPPLWPEVVGQTWAQAAGCGTQVITTRSGSISELAKGSAILIKSNNVNDLAKTIISVIKKDSKSVESLSLNRFNIKHATEEILKLYKELTPLA